jgi:hypothetical protein
MGSGSAPRAVCIALTGACLVVLAAGCGSSSRTDAAGLWCKKQGIRYAGRTPPGVDVCFTLSPDGSNWLEIGFRFLRGKGCPNPPAGIYFPGP